MLRRIFPVGFSVLSLIAGALLSAAPAGATAEQTATGLVHETITAGARQVTLVAADDHRLSVMAEMVRTRGEVSPLATNPCFGLQSLCIFENGSAGGAAAVIDGPALALPGFFNLSSISLGCCRTFDNVVGQ